MVAIAGGILAGAMACTNKEVGCARTLSPWEGVRLGCVDCEETDEVWAETA